MYTIQDMQDSGDDKPTPKFTHRFSIVFSFDSENGDPEIFSDEFLIEKIRAALDEGRFAGFDWYNTVQNHR